MTLDPVERYTLDGLASPDAPVRVLHQRLHDVPVHWHDFYELVLVLSGRSRHVCDGEAHEIGPGTALLLSPAQLHGYQAIGDEPLTCYDVVIDPLLIDPHLHELLGPASERSGWVVDDFSEARADLDRMWREHVSGLPGSGQVVDALLRCLLVEFARRLPVASGADTDTQAAPAGGADAPMRRALFHVDQHFREPLTLVAVAAQAHLSANYFSERFHAYTGVPFQAYLLQRRLRFARSLLVSTDVTVTEACHAAGFGNVSHFGRAYRSRYGHAPSAART